MFRNSSGFRFNVSFVDCTSVFVKSVLETYLLARGYNNNFLEKQFLRAANISRTNALQTNPKLLTMLYHLLSHITQHFHAFLISYANILTSYTPLTGAKTSLSNRLLLLIDVALIFVTF